MIPPEPTEGNVTIVQVPACVGLSAPVGEGAVIEDVWLGETLEQACSESEATMRACFDEFPLGARAPRTAWSSGSPPSGSKASCAWSCPATCPRPMCAASSGPPPSTA